MIIIPLIDLYSSGLDWMLSSTNQLHLGIGWFMAVSYVNGLVLEFGRKIRTPETEEPGVVSYTKLFGLSGAVWMWLGLMFLTSLLAIGASLFAGFGMVSIWFFVFGFSLCSIPAWLFIQSPSIKNSKYIEYASSLWTALMYLSLGAIPMIKNLLS